MLRIIPRVARSSSDADFGVAFLDDDGNGRYGDVFWKRVLELHTNYQVDFAGILGSVMAHEIGHLLLGAHSHAISGIMRAQWESRELNQIAMGTLLFLPWQDHPMRAKVVEWAARRVSSRDGPARRLAAPRDYDSRIRPHSNTSRRGSFSSSGAQ